MHHRIWKENCIGFLLTFFSHLQVSAGRVHLAVKQLREQLVQAQSRIRTLEAQLGNADKPVPNAPVNQPRTPPKVLIDMMLI